MSSWSRNRKFTYAAVVIIVIAALLVGFFFTFIYQKATCSDGIMNGSEQGVDCGGACSKLCPSAFLPTTVEWTRFETLAPGLYNVGAYIVNQNTSGGASNVPYHFVLFDDAGKVISDTSGTVTIPPHRNTLAFQTGVRPKNGAVPIRALFEFTSSPNWLKQSDPLQSLVISDKNYSEEGDSSSLRVTLSNSSVNTIGTLEVYAILKDQNDNVLDFSKTIIDSIPGRATVQAPFTWPVSHDGKVISIEVLPVAE